MNVKKWNDKGALEGLPLYLIILVVITAVAIVAILAWMPSNVVLDTITATGPQSDGSILDSQDGPITCAAYSTKGDPIEGVVFVIEGPSNSVGTGTTGADGTVTITLNKLPTLIQNQNVGQLDVEASYEGLMKVTTVAVVNG